MQRAGRRWPWEGVKFRTSRSAARVSKFIKSDRDSCLISGSGTRPLHPPAFHFSFSLPPLLSSLPHPRSSFAPQTCADRKFISRIIFTRRRAGATWLTARVPRKLSRSLLSSILGQSSSSFGSRVSDSFPPALVPRLFLALWSEVPLFFFSSPSLILSGYRLARFRAHSPSPVFHPQTALGHQSENRR